MARGVAWLVHEEGKLRKVLDLDVSGGEFPETTVTVRMGTPGEEQLEQVWRLDHIDEEGEAHYAQDRTRSVAVITAKNARSVAELRRKVQQRLALDLFGIDREKAAVDPSEAIKMTRAYAIDTLLDASAERSERLNAAELLRRTVTQDDMKARPREAEPAAEADGGGPRFSLRKGVI